MPQRGRTLHMGDLMFSYRLRQQTRVARALP